MPGYWFRSWHGAPVDLKWQAVAVRAGVKTGVVSAVAWALLDYASQQDERGSVDGFDVETYAVYSGFSEEEITATIRAMEDKGIIAGGRFAAWEKRQPEREDSSAERVAKHREMKRSVTQCNAEKRTVTHCDAPEEDTDTDTELELKESTTTAGAGEIGELYRTYEQEIGVLTPAVAQNVEAAVGEYGALWVKTAIHEAATYGKRSWAYILAILRRWRTDGFQADGRKNAPKSEEKAAAEAEAAAEKKRAEVAALRENIRQQRERMLANGITPFA